MNVVYGGTAAQMIKDKVPDLTVRKICMKAIEDAAESLGSLYKNKHTGIFGQLGMLSFNGNKIITTGGGGYIVTNDKLFAVKAKHLTTTAKVPHKWDFNRDMICYKHRMPNLNTTLLLAQLEKLNNFIKNKRKLAGDYEKFFKTIDYFFFRDPEDSRSNYWLNVILLKNKNQRGEFLDYTNKNSVMTRPTWMLINKLQMFKDCHQSDLKNAKYLEERIVNIQSSVRF